MTRNYPRLAIEDFGRVLLESRDIDPVYDAINAMDWAGGEAQRDRWLLGYLLCYHPGAVCWLSDPQRETSYWDGLRVAAENRFEAPVGGRWPRAPERRHWRGENATKSVAYLTSRYETATDFISYCAGGHDGWSDPEPYADVARRVKEHYAFGDWVAYKVADMLERCCGVPVRFTFDDAMYESPTSAAIRLWLDRQGLDPVHTRPRDPKAAVRTVVAYLLNVFGDYEAPGGGRPFGLTEAETVLCKAQSHMNGHYPLYNDLREIRAGLEPWARVSRTAEQFLSVFPSLPSDASRD